MVREGLPTRLALGRAAATTTGLPAQQEADWQHAWTGCRERWTLDDLRKACRWLEAGGWGYRGRLTPKALAKGLEEVLQESHAWDGRAPPDERPKKRHQRVQPLPAERAPNLDHVRAHMRRKGEPR